MSFQTTLEKIHRFVVHDAWTADASTLPGLQGFVVRVLRISRLIVQGVKEDDLAVRAAALTFSTLIALVPVLAIVFAVLKGLGAGEDALIRVEEGLDAMPVEFQNFVEQMLDIVNRTNFWALGWVGVLILFVTLIQVLNSVEMTFNRVWGVHTPRAIWRRTANYISVTVIVPVLIMSAFAASAGVANEAFMVKLGEAAPFVTSLLKLTPFVVTATAFFFLFMFVPNTSVRIRSALGGAVITALLWTLWQQSYISLQVGVARYNAIYGTFASVPIFLMWLFVCWIIILLGAEVAFAFQNHETFHMERMSARASFRTRWTLAFELLREAAAKFHRGGGALDVEAYSHQHRVPIRLVQDVVHQLTDGGYLAELADHEGSYVLLRSPDQISLNHIIRLLVDEGADPGALGMTRGKLGTSAALQWVDEGLSQHLEARTVEDLLGAEA
ncbi:MAG: YihY family inner membrane protein [Verrucomicrobia bacterium]|nr:YihY family inner membrane protein [Verrucomicrobiota bacterium]